MNEYDQALVRLLKAAGRLFSFLLRRLLVLLAPYLAPIVGVLLIFLFAYTALMVLPRYIVHEAKAAVVAIFHTGRGDDWTPEKDLELKRKYEELGRKWSEGLETKEKLRERLGPDWQEEIDAGLVLSEYDQAEPYRLPWAVMAGVDRILGDPAVQGGKERKTRPEETYKALKPEFTWKEYAFKKTVEETETVIDSEGNTRQRIVTRTIRARVKLLEEARTYEASYYFTYKPKTIRRGEPGDGSVIELFVLDTVERSGPYFKPLSDYMAANGVNKPIDVETALRLAMVYDESYAADLNLLGTVDYGFTLDFARQYWQGPEGPRAAPLPPEYMRQVTSPFGMRVHPVYGTWRFHSGVDLGAPEGTPVAAFQNGLVIFAGPMGAYGNTVVIDHGSFKTFYGHLSSILVKKGAEVRSGEAIGRVGSTGVSTGPHLHFEVRVVEGNRERLVDPIQYLRGGKEK